VGDLYQGALAPEAYVFNVTPGDSGLDLSTVSAASLKVYRPDGTVVDWATALSNQTATTLTLTYEFDATTSELDIGGDYLVYAILTIPSGFMTTERVKRRVRWRHEVNP